MIIRMIRNVVFDIGNVLTDFRWKEFLQDKGFDEAMIKRIAQASVLSPFWNEFDRGEWDADKLMAEYAGKTVVLGVRPEDFHTESAFLEMSEDSTVEAEVEIAEMMGAEIYIHAVCGGQKLIVRAPSRVQAESGDHISLAIDKNKIHLFDKETEQAINIK